MQNGIESNAKGELGETKIVVFVSIKRHDVKNGSRSINHIPDYALAAFLDVDIFVNDFTNDFHAFGIIELLLRIVIFR